MHPPTRRRVLRALGASCVAALAGCPDDSSTPTATSGPSTPSPTDTATDSPTETRTESPTATPVAGVPWAFETEDEQMSSPAVAPVVAGDSSTAQSDGATVYAGSGDGTLYALDATSRAIRWTAPIDHEVLGAPTVVEFGSDQRGPAGSWTVYVGSGSGVVRALDARTGEVQWSVELSGEVPPDPTVVDGTVYVGSYTFVYALDAATGEQRWSRQTRDVHHARIFASPTVYDGTVYVGNGDGGLYAIDAATGEEEWVFEEPRRILSTATVVDDTLYFGGEDGKVYALDPEDGTVVWSYETEEPEEIRAAVTSSPAVVDGTLYVGSRCSYTGCVDGDVYALDAETGEKRWQFGADANVQSSPAVADGTVFVGSQAGTVYALDAVNGARNWTFSTDGPVETTLKAHDGAVYVGSGDGNLYALDVASGG